MSLNDTLSKKENTKLISGKILIISVDGHESDVTPVHL